MADCGCRSIATTKAERQILMIALLLNATMFIVGLIASMLSQSTALLADSFDMLADALAYFLGLLAVGRAMHFKTTIAQISGILLVLLGAGVLFEVCRRAWFGSTPESSIMIIVAILSLIVNMLVLRLLRKFRHGEVHLRATWIFTRADIIANLGVIASGILIIMTKSHYPDLIVGFAIGIYVIKEAIEILKESQKTSD